MEDMDFHDAVVHGPAVGMDEEPNESAFTYVYGQMCGLHSNEAVSTRRSRFHDPLVNDPTKNLK